MPEMDTGAQAPASTGAQTPGGVPNTPAGSNAPAGGTPAEGSVQGQPQEGATQQQQDGRRRDPAQRRIDSLTRQKYQLQARLEALESLNNQGGGRGNQQQQQPSGGNGKDGPPQIGDFSDFQEYLDAKVAYQVEQKLSAARQHEQKSTSEALSRQEQQELSERWSTSIAEFSEQVPDFEEVVEATDVNVSPALMRAIMEADEGPRVLYFLAQNPKEVRKLNGMSFSAVTRNIGRLEERLLALNAKSTTSKAPKVPETVSGSGSVNTSKDPADSLPIDTWMQQERERVKKKYART